MGDVNISSRNQTGGITAQNVSSNTPTVAPEPAKDSGWVRWGTIAGIVAAIVAMITLYLTAF